MVWCTTQKPRTLTLAMQTTEPSVLVNNPIAINTGHDIRCGKSLILLIHALKKFRGSRNLVVTTKQTSAYADLSANCFDQFAGIVAHPVFEDRDHVLNVADVLRRIPLHEHDVRLFTRSKRTDGVVTSDELGAILRSDLDRLR